jgi:hypothetical protein
LVLMPSTIRCRGPRRHRCDHLPEIPRASDAEDDDTCLPPYIIDAIMGASAVTILRAAASMGIHSGTRGGAGRFVW